MVAYLQRCAPEEGCGFLAGADGVVTAVLFIENELHSPTRYRMEPQSQIDALIALDEDGAELLAIFHSHPSSRPWPSATDLTEFAYPKAYMLIVGYLDKDVESALFRINNGRIMESVLNVV